jgi:nitrate reductase delta subunit
MTRDVFEALGALYGYPDEGYGESARAVQAALEADAPDAAAAMRRFSEWVAASSLEEVQEQYIRSFDMNPSGCAEVGWHLFGENYERGELLVEMRSLLRELGIAETMELPDHLCHVLLVLARDRAGDAEPLARKFVAPALQKMMQGHAEEGPARALLEGTFAAVVASFGEPIPFTPPNRHLPVLREGGARAHG